MSRVERDCVRSLCASARTLGVALSVDVRRQTPWSSALFGGMRLTMQVEGDDDDGLDAWLIALPDLELEMTGHFVADARVVARSARAATLELLVIKED